MGMDITVVLLHIYGKQCLSVMYIYLACVGLFYGRSVTLDAWSIHLWLHLTLFTS